MSSKRILGIAGAAMIGTLAGTGAVHAEITLGDSGTEGAITFAKETFRSDRKWDVGGTTYYEGAANTGSSGELDIVVPVGLAVPVSTSAIVTVELEDLVFTGFTPTLGARTNATPPVAVTLGATTGVVTGGAAGDRRVQFQLVTNATNALTATHNLLIELDRIGVDPDKNGSITVKISREIGGVGVESETRIPDAVKSISGLRVTSTESEPIASVEEMFMKFRKTDEDTGVADNQLAANVGNLRITVATTTPANTLYNAGRGDAASMNGRVTVPAHLVSEAAVVFAGETSFLADEGEGDEAKKLVYVDRAANCSTTDSPTSIVDADDDNKLKAALGDFADTSTLTGGGYLCLKVDGETSIPATDPYTVSVGFTSLLGSNAAFLPDSSSRTLGSIKRDGSTVYIPYLTTNQKYNQRLVMVNRSNTPVEYSMTFRTAEDTTATARAAASGTLPAASDGGGRVVLDVRDIVMFAVEGRDTGGHGSAELAVVTSSSMLDVATVTTTRGDGSTDTVVLDPQ